MVPFSRRTPTGGFELAGYTLKFAPMGRLSRKILAKGRKELGDVKTAEEGVKKAAEHHRSLGESMSAQLAAALQEGKQRTYRVQISKAYFPHGTQPTKYAMSDVWDEVKVKAGSPSEAARVAWKSKGDEWLQKMGPPKTRVRKVSLNVSQPGIGPTGFAGRLPPILVHTSTAGVTEAALQEGKLKMSGEKVDAKATGSLRKVKLKAKNQGDLSSAVISAGYYAKKWGQTMYVYAGDSFGHAIWRVTAKQSDALNPINNSGRRLLSVSPDLTVKRYDVGD